MISRPAWRWWLAAVILPGLLGPLQAQTSLRIASPVFANGQALPKSAGREHGNLRPELFFYGVPPEAKSLAVVMDDPDAPSGLFTHWVAWNILASTSELPAGSLSIAIVEGRNGFGDVGYDGPAPPSGTHRYFFHLYALDMMLDLAPGSDGEVLSQAMKGHVVARAETMGTYAAGD